MVDVGNHVQLNICYKLYFVGKHLFSRKVLADVCPQCQQENSLTLKSASNGSVIVVNQKGNRDVGTLKMVQLDNRSNFLLKVTCLDC